MTRWCSVLMLCGLVALAGCQAEVRFAAGIDHAPLTALLERYVDEQGLIDYDRWRQTPADRQALRTYLQAYARAPAEAAAGADRQAGLINLYNALVIADVLQRVEGRESYWSLDPFDDQRHEVGGVVVSLDDIEHGAARPAIGYRVHAALVCAAISCPPLRRQAYLADDLATELDRAMAAWLADPRLNRYDPEENLAEVSKIFDWFAADFEAAGGIPIVLQRHGPERHRELFDDPALRIAYLPYDKSLNAQPETTSK